MSCSFNVVILAAGRGKRMGSLHSKMLMKIANRELLCHVIDTAVDLFPRSITIVASAMVVEFLPKNTNLHILLQDEPLGTGHATLIGCDFLQKSGIDGGVLVLLGDTLISHSSLLKDGILNNPQSDVILFGMELSQENDYGRIYMSENGKACKIVEKRFLTNTESDKYLCNAGAIFLSKNAVNLLRDLRNESGEYLLTDIVAIAYENSLNISCVKCQEDDFIGVNSRDDFLKAERSYQYRLKRKLWLNGVTFIDEESIYLSYDVKIAQGAIVYPNSFFDVNVSIGENAKILPFCYLSNCVISSFASVGPFATIKDSSHIDENVVVGNFTEINRSRLGANTKVKHLSYVGDTEIGDKVNVGAGVVFCNFDGLNKYKTKVGRGSFIGANSSIVAPVMIGDDAIITASSVVRQNVEDNAICTTKIKQCNLKNAASRYKMMKKK
ncbi:NTP transferase domain-containing protein [Candidatus Gromoviella agglomerans]|uniref:NTP transferase domain-containing protein n=1 Tax=Candidatus Gromoviella agglomerans TaxID=2806609 RepID=UPI001E2B4376|nr:NTP transferase domain-containing protein [Candidatus Gromoviella agglomerans]UFX98278.1 Bifunctional protein GlmU [Candidatus Gromoviella agglomerans]